MQICRQKESGTHGRKWYTDQNNNIAFSLIINCECNVERLNGITTEIAEIIIETIRKIYNINLQIKFPNDIFFNGKKIGGILTEIKSERETAKNMVIGIGINTNQEVFAKEIENIATSIKKEFKIEVDTQQIISEFCNLFEKKL